MVNNHVMELEAVSSLQRTQNHQILDSQEMFEFCQEKTKDINFFLISKNDIDLTRKIINKRFQGTFSVLGTITLHQYVPLTESVIGVKRCSEDENYSLKHNLLSKYYVPVDIKVSDYVAVFQQIIFILTSPFHSNYTFS